MTSSTPIRSRTLRAAATLVAAAALLHIPLGDAPGRSPQASGSSGALELRYFILKAGSDKSKVTENPEAGLSTGDQVALRVEPTLRGHLYVFFHAEGASPAMIFPNLERAASDVKGETAIEIPSSRSRMSQWWEVRDGPGTDRFYVVLSREPLPDVPVGEALVRHCATIRGQCYWEPPAPLWKSIVSHGRPGVLAPVAPAAKESVAGPKRPPVPERRPPLTILAAPGAPMAVAVVETKIKGTLQAATSEIRGARP